MDLRNLELFLHLADSLHFGKSADAMAVSPSTLSRAIQRLEQETGCILFERDNRQRNPVDAVAAVIAEIQANSKRTLPSEDRGERTLQCHR